MGLLEPVHLLIIGLAVILLFGPKKIPELMRGLGKGMGELQKGINEGKRMLNQAVEVAHEESKVDLYHQEDPNPVTAKLETPMVEPPKVEAFKAPSADSAELSSTAKPAKPAPKARATKPASQA